MFFIFQAKKSKIILLSCGTEQIDEIASSSSTNQPPTLTASMLSQLTKSWSEESSNNNIIQRQLESLINSNSEYFLTQYQREKVSCEWNFIRVSQFCIESGKTKPVSSLVVT